MRYLLLVSSLIFAVGCAGGGGSVHNPPDHIVAGQPTTLKLSFSVWGAGSGDLAKRYTKILCHYRKVGEAQFQSVSARIISSDEKRMVVEFVVPPQQLSTPSESLEYYFDCLFDGHANSRPHEIVQIIETRPNQTLQPTADRQETLHMRTSTSKFEAQFASVSGG
jgi:hypothetical protein